MKRSVYLDNAATSYPKAPGVAEKIADFIKNSGVNINRGCYEKAYGAASTVLETRKLLAEMFAYPTSQNVIFTANVTTSLNMIIKGFFKPGNHLLISSLEHNAVMRPLLQMAESGVNFDRIPCSPSGEMELDTIEKLINHHTKAIVTTHASNVCGTLMPLSELGLICAKHQIALIVDAAQTAGIFPIDMEKANISALAFTGHKGLLGPQGIGGFIVKPDLATQLTPLISGGTGSISHLETIPEFLPDKFEPGTANIPAIIGLHTALEYINQQGMHHIKEIELDLWQRFIDGCREMLPQATICGTQDRDKTVPVISLDFPQDDNARIAFLLDDQYGIMTRCGLHCSPAAHKILGTYPHGTLRFSFSHFNTEEEIDYTLVALKKITQKKQHRL